MENNENKPKGPWKATRDNINKEEIEKAREVLVNSYHSYVQTHAGYMIAIALGFFCTHF